MRFQLVFYSTSNTLSANVPLTRMAPPVLVFKLPRSFFPFIIASCGSRSPEANLPQLKRSNSLSSGRIDNLEICPINKNMF